MAVPFSVPIEVRGYETDALGHVNQAVYLQYGEHGRTALLRAAGIGGRELIGAGLGAVALEINIKYLRELRVYDRFDLSCAFVWGDGKVFDVAQTFTKADGTVSAELTAKFGIIDLTARKLVANPREVLRSLAKDPAVLGL